jgi:polyisoprenoid-binding protein YceI
MNVAEIDAPHLKELLDGESPPVLVDVLPEEAHEELRIPGSVNACIYDVTFLSKMEELAPDRDRPVVVYGSAPGVLDAADAADRLLRAGWEQVSALRGGRQAWLEADLPVEGAEERWTPAPPRPIPDGTFSVDTGESVVEWTGRNLGGRHYGTLRFSEGSVTVAEGQVTGLDLVADLGTIEVGDLTGKLAKGLIDHLRSEDFFAAYRYPTARFVLGSLTPIPGATPGRPDHRARGTLAIRGREQEIECRAQVAPGKDGGILLQATTTVDRTRFGVTYGSGRLYHRLGMHLVNDEIDLAIRVQGT